MRTEQENVSETPRAMLGKSMWGFYKQLIFCFVLFLFLAPPKKMILRRYRNKTHTYFNTMQIILNWLWCRIKINLVRKEGRHRLHVPTKPSVEMLKLEHSCDRGLSCSLNWIVKGKNDPILFNVTIPMRVIKIWSSVSFFRSNVFLKWGLIVPIYTLAADSPSQAGN